MQNQNPTTSVNTEQCDTLDLGQPSVELGQLLIALCDFRSATNLLCLNHAWAALAKEDITWRPLATTIAREARLHFDTSRSTGEWRTKCRRLFSARGTFVSECFGAPTPAPERAPFHIAVGCRFRPPGGTAGPAQEVPREVVLPLHQRLQFIAAAHNCTLAEARKRLWAPEASESVDPFASSSCAGPAEDEAAKENLDANHHASVEGMAAVGDDYDGSGQGGAPAQGGADGADGASSASAAGLIALQGGQAIICAPGAGIRAFEFEHTFAGEASQADVYDAAVAPLVAGVLNGRSACVLAYGQTGSGKTFTMSGPGAGVSPSAATAGLAPRAVLSLLRAAQEREAAGVSVSLKMSSVEVFGEQITDLLHAGASIGGFWSGVAAAATAAGYADEPLESASQALELLERAELSKRRAATQMNERSSRAHSLLMLTLEQRALGEPEGVPPVVSQLCLADLGGSEKVKRSGVRGEQLREAIYINKGLLALKSVMSALNQKHAHIPFKDDQLTMLLRPSLSGGAQTYVILAARPEGEHALETMQALRFGETCAAVEVAAKGGSDRQAQSALAALDAQVKELERLIVEKERFETHIERRRDQRAGLLDAYGAGAALTDMAYEEKKVSRIVGAEKERAALERILAARRSLLGE